MKVVYAVDRDGEFGTPMVFESDAKALIELPRMFRSLYRYGDLDLVEMSECRICKLAIYDDLSGLFFNVDEPAEWLYPLEWITVSDAASKLDIDGQVKQVDLLNQLVIQIEERKNDGIPN